MTIPSLASDQRRALVSWALYDWAMSAFNTVIGTFVFAVYVTRGVAGDEVAGTAAWGQAMAASGVALLILSPVLGAIADRGGARKPWLAVMTLITVVLTASLWWVRPEPGYLTTALVTVAVATTCFELANVFYNAMLPGLAPAAMLGRVSGWGWGIGYFGGLGCLIVALFGFVGEGSPADSLLDASAAEPVRATAWLVAVWYGLFCLPLFLWVPDLGARHDGVRHGIVRVVRDGLRQLVQTLQRARRQGNLLRFLVASAFYRDGINTITAFGGIYAAGTFGMSFEEIITFAIALNVLAGAGAVGFGWVDDRAGPRLTILVALVGLSVCGAALLLVSDKLWFWVFALGLGLFFGPSQAAGRTLMARMAPAGQEAEMFGLYGFAGRAVGFLGPMAVAVATDAFASQRAGMATILIFFAVGFVGMLMVRESPGLGKE